MKHFVVELTYKAPLETMDRHVAAHRTFLQEGYDAGILLMSGPQTPRVGGVIIARAESKELLDGFLARDPFRIERLADYRFVEFTPVKRADCLAAWVA